MDAASPGFFCWQSCNSPSLALISCVISAIPRACAEVPGGGKLGQEAPTGTKHKVEHHIRVRDGPPITTKFRGLDTEKLAAAKVELDQLEQDRIIRRSDSPWASPLHMVRKPDWIWRPVTTTAVLTSSPSQNPTHC
jgi:hypothetical protein